MNSHGLAVLELAAVLERVAERASSPLGRAAVLDRRPGDGPADELQRELSRVTETLTLLDAIGGVGLPEIPDGTAALGRLALAGGVLDGRELHSVGGLLRSARELLALLEPRTDDLPLLAGLALRLHPDGDIEARIERTVDPDGSVLDGASRELARIRKALRVARNRIVRQLEAFLATLPDRWRVPDASVSVREGRYVIPLRREGRREVGGIVHSESSSGATVFLEPPLAIQLANDLEDLQQDEAREVQRILRAFTDELRPSVPLLDGSQDALVEFDSLYARARTASAWRGHEPTLLPPGSEELSVRDGRHPLLSLRSDVTVVPFDLTLEPGERGMVVSGPNTGGKSVFLKALGLTSALAQCGVIPPVGPGTRLPVFSRIFADIGDEQSITEDLSTFSAHLANLREILEEADGSSLVLIDEMGTGTDPAEGAALARATLEELVHRRALVVVTSHLGDLKRLDTEGSGIVNASLQFDPDRIEPTYRFLKGRPGRSYGLAIARRLGFPSDVLRHAESFRPSGDADVEELLARLEAREKEAAELVESLRREREEADRLRRELQERERQLEEAERTAERRSREEARRLLLEAREEVERAIREVRDGGEAELEDASRRARRRVEQAASRHRRLAPEPPTAPVADVAEGDTVRLAAGGSSGTVIELRGERATVEVGGLRIEVPRSELTPAPGASRVESHGIRREVASWSAPDVVASTEMDLRGLRVDEVDQELARALDRAVLGDLREVRIIHGKGTGALRARVAELLEADPRVEAFRIGLTEEGGSGVTIARLR